MAEISSPRPGRGFALRLVAASLVGLDEALHGPRKEEPAIVGEAPGEPLDDPVELRLDRDHPERSRVIIRAWKSPWGFPG